MNDHHTKSDLNISEVHFFGSSRQSRHANPFSSLEGVLAFARVGIARKRVEPEREHEDARRGVEGTGERGAQQRLVLRPRRARRNKKAPLGVPEQKGIICRCVKRYKARSRSAARPGFEKCS